MGFKKSAEEKPRHGHFEGIRGMLNQRAFPEVHDTHVDLLFESLEMAQVFKNQFEREVQAMYPGKRIRWKGRVWNNQPSCEIAKVSKRAEMENYTNEKFVFETRRAENSCLCYSCKLRNEKK